MAAPLGLVQIAARRHTVPAFECVAEGRGVDVAIEALGTQVQDVVTTTHLGPTMLTERSVKGEGQRRWETKNVLGMVAWVTDGTGAQIRYQYDADGN